VPALVGELSWDAPLRLLGGLHALVLSGRASWDDLDGALAHDDLSRLAARSIQTNEVRRSWALLPCFLEVARRTGAVTFDLIELGPSAGFNLLWDRYRYAYEAGTWGPADALLELDGDERRSVPAELLELAPRVRNRVGVDRDPVDVTTDEGARLLEAFVWPGQAERLERLRAAIAIVRDDPPELVRGDYVDLLPSLLRERRDGSLTVVFSSVSTIYLPEERYQELASTLARAGRDGPLAWVSFEAPRDDRDYGGVALDVTVWPGGTTRRLAKVDFHSDWLEWCA
jgi:hypothetical protein